MAVAVLSLAVSLAAGVALWVACAAVVLGRVSVAVVLAAAAVVAVVAVVAASLAMAASAAVMGTVAAGTSGLSLCCLCRRVGPRRRCVSRGRLLLPFPRWRARLPPQGWACRFRSVPRLVL